MPAPRICHIGRAERAGSTWQTLERAKDLGFDTVLAEMGGGEPVSATLTRACESRGLSLFLDLNVHELDLHHPLVKEFPERFAIRRLGEPGAVVDPRYPSVGKGYAYLREREDLAPLIDWWSDQVEGWLDVGVRGFRLLKPATTAGPLREGLMARARRHGSNRITFIADTIGEPWDRVRALSGVDYCLSSLPWWDGRAPWLIDEY